MGDAVTEVTSSSATQDEAEAMILGKAPFRRPGEHRRCRCLTPAPSFPERQVRIFSKRFDIPAEAIDRQGHVNNVAYVTWMQEVAIEHSTAVGWPMDRYHALGAGWVVRSHFVEYLRPTFAGERLAVYTWLPEFTHRATPRRYWFVREDAVQLVAQAETRWVFIDLRTGRRRPLPDELIASFEVVADEAEVRRACGLDR